MYNIIYIYPDHSTSKNGASPHHFLKLDQFWWYLEGLGRSKVYISKY